MVGESVAASRVEREPERILPWTQRLHDAHPVPPWQVGTAIFLALTLLFCGVEVALGRHRMIVDFAPDSPALRNVRLAILLFLSAAYAVAASLYLVRRERESLAALLPHLRVTAAEADTLRAVPGQFRRATLWRGGLIGLAVALLIPLLADPARVLYDPRQWDSEMYWHRVILLALGWWLGRMTLLVVTQSLRMRELVRRLPELDLFDPAPLRPFASQVSSHALVLAGVTGILALNLLEERFGLMVGTLVVMNAAFAALTVFGPLRGIRDRLRAAKTRALAWCRGELAGAAARLEGDVPEPGATGRMADLVAYETRVEAVAEWPFDAGAIRRLAFYLLIPLISWLGGALVERLIDSLLD
jgi:hypothetical protein